MAYCTISTVSSVTHHGQKKSPCFKSLELKRKFIGHLGLQFFGIHELTVKMVQYCIPVLQCQGYSQVNYVAMVILSLSILICISKILLSSKVSHPKTMEQSEFETLTNATNHHVCFHPASHLINSKCEATTCKSQGVDDKERG